MRCKARNILTGMALVKRAIKILSILSVQSEVEDDFIAAIYGRGWPQSELEVIVSRMEKYSVEYFIDIFAMNMIYFIYRVCYRYWISLQAVGWQIWSRFAVSVENFMEIHHRSSNFSTFHFQYFGNHFQWFIIFKLNIKYKFLFEKKIFAIYDRLFLKSNGI